MPVNTTTMMVVLVCFIIAGAVGVYVGDQLIRASDIPETNSTVTSLYNSQQSLVSTFEFGVILCKILVIGSVASIVFILLQKNGLIPRSGDE